jgi:toxin ParE1/3/4
MRRVRILDEAAQEAVEAAAWYELQRLGLGAEFERALDAALDLLEEEIVPLTAMPGVAGRRGAKRLILKRFPYSIVVSERSDELIVVAFAHQSRRPSYWRSRL